MIYAGGELLPEPFIYLSIADKWFNLSPSIRTRWDWEPKLAFQVCAWALETISEQIYEPIQFANSNLFCPTEIGDDWA